MTVDEAKEAWIKQVPVVCQRFEKPIGYPVKLKRIKSIIYSLKDINADVQVILELEDYNERTVIYAPPDICKLE